MICGHMRELMALGSALPRPLSFSGSDGAALDVALLRFVVQGIV